MLRHRCCESDLLQWLVMSGRPSRSVRMISERERHDSKCVVDGDVDVCRNVLEREHGFGTGLVEPERVDGRRTGVQFRLSRGVRTGLQRFKLQ